MTDPTRPIVVIGDALLDRDVEGSVERVSPDAHVPVIDEATRRSRPGGAGLAAALLAADGWPVTLITALGPDAAGRELARALDARGVDVVDLGLEGATPEKIRLMADGRPLLRLDRGGREPPRLPAAGAGARAAIGWAGAILVSDYGRGVTRDVVLRQALADVPERVPVVWDPHPRGAAPAPGVTLATPNEAEAVGVAPDASAGGTAGLAERAEAIRRHWAAEHVCVTRGAAGALLVGEHDAPVEVPAPAVRGGDPCGAGDRFASRAIAALADGASPAAAVREAVEAASAYVAAGGAAGALAAAKPAAPLTPTANGALPVVDRVRAGAGAVVATGGCFDLLHAGHIRTLEAARALGDCLVVCLNSDESVRRLKGPDRPLVSQEDRASVLLALRCVDAVVVFEEDTPETTLEALRPDVWAKGGDYAGVELPEAAIVERWGGRAVVLPYVAGRSTTRLIEEAALHVAG